MLAAVFRRDTLVRLVNQRYRVKLGTVNDVVGLCLLEVLLDLIECELNWVVLRRVRRVVDRSELELPHLFLHALVAVDR